MSVCVSVCVCECECVCGLRCVCVGKFGQVWASLGRFLLSQTMCQLAECGISCSHSIDKT